MQFLILKRLPHFNFFSSKAATSNHTCKLAAILRAVPTFAFCASPDRPRKSGFLTAMPA